MAICGVEQHPKVGPVLTCACETDGKFHIHRTTDGTCFIDSLAGVLVFEGAR